MIIDEHGALKRPAEMASDGPSHRRNRSTPQAIPLQDLNRSQGEDGSARAGAEDLGHRRTLSDRGRSMFRSNRESILNRNPLGRRYAPIVEDSPSPPFQRDAVSPQTLLTTPSGLHAPAAYDDNNNEPPFSPIADPGAFQSAVNFGLSFDGSASNPSPTDAPRAKRASRSSLPALRTVNSTPSLIEEMDDATEYFPPENDMSDTVPLTDVSRLRANSARSLGPTTLTGQSQDRERSSFQSVRFLSPTGSRLGDDLRDTESGLTPDGSSRFSRSGSGRQRSLSPASAESPLNPLHRAGTMMRKMSQRVVNLSNEPEIVEQSIRRSRKASVLRSPHLELPDPIIEATDFGAADGAASIKSPASEKMPSPISPSPELQIPHREPNPLKGKSLGIFPPDSNIRLKLCDLLIHPATEPIILVLIVIQTILLAVDSSRSVINDPRSKRWGTSWIDYGLLALFSIYTVEIIVRCIVSGFIVNPIEYSTINREIGLRQAVMNKANDLFAFQKKPSVKVTTPTFVPQQLSLLRSFTAQTFDDIHGGSRLAQKKRLAYRAFLRHSFNRLDFLAVVSFWISFLIGVFGVESSRHVYVFRMLSCLRILRLLGITSGTSVSKVVAALVRI